MPAAPKSRLLIDLSGLISWYSIFSIPTGIQRVVERIVLAPAFMEHPDVVHVARAPGTTGFFVIDKSIVLGLGSTETRAAAVQRIRRLYIQLLKRAPLIPSLREIDRARWKYLASARLGLPCGAQSSRPADMPADPEVLTDAGSRDVLVNLGDLWPYRGHSSALSDFKTRHRLELVVMIHDLFPFAQPGWMPASFRRTFAQRFAALAPAVDRWLVNSSFIGQELQRDQAARGCDSAALHIVPMGWEFDDRAPRDQPEVLRRFGLEAQTYFLQVGTLEPRKNHLSVVRAVESLAEAGVPLPTCVFVGMRGWQGEALLEFIATTRYAKDRIRWLQTVSEADLDGLYRGALFTVYPSLSEGWGLPVQESLSRGIPCIASNAGAVPEAGLDLARYVDPNDQAQITAAIERYARDPAALSADRSRLSARLSGREKLPSWNDTARAVLRAAGR
jgi:glycosyltransferase involved in cell wall biosynthesis